MFNSTFDTLFFFIFFPTLNFNVAFVFQLPDIDVIVIAAFIFRVPSIDGIVIINLKSCLLILLINFTVF